jgi:hypothetical protein
MFARKDRCIRLSTHLTTIRFRSYWRSPSYRLVILKAPARAKSSEAGSHDLRRLISLIQHLVSPPGRNRRRCIDTSGMVAFDEETHSRKLFPYRIFTPGEQVDWQIAADLAQTGRVGENGGSRKERFARCRLKRAKTQRIFHERVDTSYRGSTNRTVSAPAGRAGSGCCLRREPILPVASGHPGRRNQRGRVRRSHCCVQCSKAGRQMIPCCALAE